LPSELLSRLLAKIHRDDPRVIVGPGVGEDAAFLDFGDTLLVAKTDPVTFATDLIGWYAVQVNANDIACCGAVPKWFLATALFPVGTTPIEVELVFDQLVEACDALGVTMIGGHSEMTLDLPRTIISGTMLGEVPKGDEVMTAGARPGDRVILTKGIAIEGTSLLACEMRPQLESAGVAADVIDRAANYLYEPGISVVPEARAAHATGGVTSMHDPTSRNRFRDRRHHQRERRHSPAGGGRVMWCLRRGSVGIDLIGCTADNGRARESVRSDRRRCRSRNPGSRHRRDQTT